MKEYMTKQGVVRVFEEHREFLLSAVPQPGEPYIFDASQAVDMDVHLPYEVSVAQDRLHAGFVRLEDAVAYAAGLLQQAQSRAKRSQRVRAVSGGQRVVTVHLDADYDCMVAGLPRGKDYLEAFEDAYCRAAAEHAELLGIRINVKLVDRPTHWEDEPEAEAIWQDIHSRMTVPEPLVRYTCVGECAGKCWALHKNEATAELCIDTFRCVCVARGEHCDRLVREIRGGSVADLYAELRSL